MPPRLPCPKCGGYSWIEQESQTDLVQRCLCGLMVFLERAVGGGVTVSKRAVQQDQVQLPQTGTKIHRCLMAVAEQYPRPIKTAVIAKDAGLQSKETASLVVALMARGLLERVEERRGLTGGSIWELSHATKKLLKLKGGYVNGTGT